MNGKEGERKKERPKKGRRWILEEEESRKKGKKEEKKEGKKALSVDTERLGRQRKTLGASKSEYKPWL